MLNLDFIWGGNSIRFQSFFPEVWYRQYILVLYVAFYMITGGEVVPQTNVESTTAILLLVIFAVVNNTILTIFAQYAEELQHKAAELQKTIDLTNTAMANLGLTQDLRKDVLEYVQNTHNTKERQNEISDFI